MWQQTTHQEGKIETRTYASFLAHPDDMDRYNSSIEHGADRILRLTESEQEHRHKVDLLRAQAEINLATRGQWFALFVSIFFGAIAAILVFTGHEWAGAALGVGDIAGLASVFIYGSISNRKERVEKAKILAGQPSDG